MKTKKSMCSTQASYLVEWTNYLPKYLHKYLPILCNFCGHMSLCNSALKDHIAVVRLKPYECKTCRKCFTNIYARTVHVQKVHESTKTTYSK